jgi:hypothetical protein
VLNSKLENIHVKHTKYHLFSATPPDASHLPPRPSRTPTTTARHNLKNHLARLLAPIAATDYLDSFVLGLVTRNLDLGAGFLAQVVDSAAAGADDEPVG